MSSAQSADPKNRPKRPDVEAAKSRLITYHGKCMDGFGAAYSVWASLTPQAAAATVFQEYMHGEPFVPARRGDDVTMYCLDYAPPIPLLKVLAIQFKRIHIIDHHAGNAAAYAEASTEIPPNVRADFRMEHSGAILAWRHFRPHSEPPTLLQYIEDRDLWKNKLECSREVSAYLMSQPKDFEKWDEIRIWMQDRVAFRELVDIGRTLLDSNEQTVADLVEHARFINILGHSVPVVNSPVLQSEVAHELLERYPEAKFAAVYCDRQKLRTWSLRSREDFDVSAVAKRFGGGGHPQAAGFSTPLG